MDGRMVIEKSDSSNDPLIRDAMKFIQIGHYGKVCFYHYREGKLLLVSNNAMYKLPFNNDEHAEDFVRHLESIFEG